MFLLAIIFIAVLVGIDQYTKLLAVSNLNYSDNIVLIKGFLGLTLTENRGAAFGIFQGARWSFVVLTAIVLITICVYYVKLPKSKVNTWVKFSLILITSGAIGNFIDRLLNGYVIDFLQFLFINFPIFNMADVFVVSGTVLLSFLLIFFVKDEKKEAVE